MFLTYLQYELTALQQRDVLPYALSRAPAPRKEELIHPLDIFTVTQPPVRIPDTGIFPKNRLVPIYDRGRRTYGCPLGNDTAICQH